MAKKIELDFSPKLEPLPHQIEATAFIEENNVVALFDEQGLGKSKTVIDALCYNIRDKVVEGAIIICSKTLIKTWENEILRHSHLFPVSLTGTRKTRGRRFLTYGHFYIVNYESLLHETELIELILKQKSYAIVLDESQKIKNPEAKITKTILNLREFPKKKVIISGTPITNKPEDIWTQIYFLDDGELLGKSFTVFRKKYAIDLRGKTSIEENRKNLAELQNKINSISIRRTKDILELPEKLYIDIKIALAEKQREIYDVARDELYIRIKNTDGAEIIKDIDNILVKLLRLTQIASNPSLVKVDFDEVPTKYLILDSLVQEIIEREEKVIIWSSFVGNIRELRRRYKEAGALMLFGEMTIEERNTAVDRFMKSPRNKVLVANPAAAKEGLTLTSANNAIYIDRNFKMDDYVQSQDRIHRIGQEKKCTIYKLIAEKTIDEYTDEILEKKELISKYLLGDSEEIAIDVDFLSKEDLLEALGW